MRRQMTRVDQATRVPEAGDLAIVLLGDRAAMLSYAANRRPGADAGCRPAAPLRAPASGAIDHSPHLHDGDLTFLAQLGQRAVETVRP